MDDFGLIELARSVRRLASWATAVELGAIAELSARRRAQGEKLGAWDSEVGEWVSDEVAAALTLSCGAAAHRVVMAEQLATTLQLTFGALRDGRIDADKARVIADGLRGVLPGVAAEVERRVLPAAPEQTCAQLRYAVRKAIEDIDPAGCTERRRAAEESRRLELWDSDAGTSDLSGRDLPATAATAAWNRVNAIAAALKADGDPRTIDQLRADVFLGLLRNERPAPAQSRDDTSPLGESDRLGASGPATATAPGAEDGSDLGVPDLSEPWPTGHGDTLGRHARGPMPRGVNLAGADSAPGDVADTPVLAGSGAAARGVRDASADSTDSTNSADHAEEWSAADVVAGAVREGLTGLTGGLGRDGRRRGGQAVLVNEAVRRIKAATAELGSRWCTTITDEGVRHGADSYRVPAAMRRSLHARDGTCRFPGCGRAADRCDADHTEPYHQGGATCLCNLALLCRRHHRLKQRPEWRLVQVWSGVLVWIAPTGHWYVVGPG
ncbi:MAG TPA: DUF222 domain-containing protein [Streptosporangiaceae bacterium]|nr:DUF222 domain-containing protein [Streptosporangiaceae bacterium]